jgi:hypothetical protein
VKAGAENRKKTILAGGLGAAALMSVIFIYTQLFGGNTPSSSPAPQPVIVTPSATTSSSSAGSAGQTTSSAAAVGANGATGANGGGLGVAPGVAATRLASTSAGLDPTLHEAAMLRTESLVYSGTGRNIFSATYTPPAALVIPKNVPPARPQPMAPAGPVVPPGPPPPPPIELKFFGTAQRHKGRLQGFFLNGDDVYLAAEGDIVARKYKIVQISPTSARIEDLQNDNTQSVPLQSQ